MHTRPMFCAIAAVVFIFAVAADGSAQGWKPEKQQAKDLIAELRKNPAAYSICVSPGLGAANHVGLMLPLRAPGVDVKKLRIVVFGGSPDAFASLLDG